MPSLGAKVDLMGMGARHSARNVALREAEASMACFESVFCSVFSTVCHADTRSVMRCGGGAVDISLSMNVAKCYVEASSREQPAFMEGFFSFFNDSDDTTRATTTTA